MSGGLTWRDGVKDNTRLSVCISCQGQSKCIPVARGTYNAKVKGFIGYILV